MPIFEQQLINVAGIQTHTCESYILSIIRYDG